MATAAEYAAWRPGVEDLLYDVRRQVNLMETSRAHEVFDARPHRDEVISASTQAAVQHSPLLPAELPVVGRRVDLNTRDQGSGVVTTWIPIPANGTHQFTHSPVVHSHVMTHGYSLRVHQHSGLPNPHPPPIPSSPLPRPPPPPPPSNPDPTPTQVSTEPIAKPVHQAFITYPPPHPFPPDKYQHNPKGHLSKVPFPWFDGDNPRCWRTRAEKYFKMYFVEEPLWIEISEMHFDGPASLWYQSIENLIPDLSWSDFCAKMHDRFDRDRHEALIRQLFHISQTSTVTEYLARFSELHDQLKSYSPTHDEL